MDKENISIESASGSIRRYRLEGGIGRAEIFQINPFEDPRWSDLVKRHPRSSVFHTSEWLRTLNRTYGFTPIVFSTTAPGDELQDGVVFCQVNSWLTGNRLASLPFSDHCEPLVENSASLNVILAAVSRQLRDTRTRYAEIRPACSFELNDKFTHSSVSYSLHRLDLRPNLETLFSSCHKDSTQRKVLRAERERLIYEEGRSDNLFRVFYRLMVETRRRHGLPPQPEAWFKNLIRHFGDNLKFRVAFRDGTAAAAILTLQHKDTLVYKYGCSDSSFHRFGPVQFLFWKAIVDAKGQGLNVFDLGRSDLDNPGLITFKDRLGSTRSAITYHRFSADPGRPAAFSGAGAKWNLPRTIVSRLPQRVLRALGCVMYRHVG
jgi:CelD/BcsL family acetyltransferase involved in cellulose biosynthesis